MKILLFFIATVILSCSAEETSAVEDGDQSRKILGSSVVTSVSVIMDTGNGTKTIYTDAIGKPIGKPASAGDLASPINLLNPDRYEFYTFDDNGDLIKRLMSLDEIKGIIATGDSEGLDLDSFTSLGYLPEKKVNDVVNNVQNVLKEEMETHKNNLDKNKPIFDTPDVSDSWSMILPAVFGNSGDDIIPEKPLTHVTPDTIMIEPNSHLSTPDEVNLLVSSTIRPHTPISTIKPSHTSLYPSSGSPIQLSSAPSTSRIPVISTTERPVQSTSGMRPVASISSFNPFNSTIRLPTIFSTISGTVKPVTVSHSTERPFIKLSTFSSTFKPFGINSGTTPYRLPVSISTRHAISSTQYTAETFAPVSVASTSSPQSSTSATQRSTTAPPLPVYTSNKLSTQNLISKPATSTNSYGNINKDEIKPLINVQVFSNSKSTTEIPQLAPIKLSTRSTTVMPATSNLFSTYTKMAIKTSSSSTTLTTTEDSKKQSTISSPTFTTSASAKPLTSTHITQKPAITSTESILSTWRPLPMTTAEKEVSPSTSEPHLSTWRSTSTSESADQPLIANDEQIQKLPTLAELLQQNSDDEQDIATTSRLTTLVTLHNENATTQQETTIRPYTSEISDEDLSTMGSEYLGGLQTQKDGTETTPLTLEQSMSSTDKLSASELLHLLYTTNIYEINTELAEKTTNTQLADDVNERFEISTQQETRSPELETQNPTTEPFLIRITESTDLQTTTDRSIIESIEQLLSQAVNNVDGVVTNINDTKKIEEMLQNSGKKNFTDLQQETATLASNMIDQNIKTEEIVSTTELPMIANDESDILNESVGSLLSQIYDNPNSGSMSTIAYRSSDGTTIEVTSTERLIPTIKNSDKDIEGTTVEINTTPIFSEKEDSLNDTPIIHIAMINSDKYKNRTKPAKLDTSLENMYEEESKNLTQIINENDSTEIYIEKIFNISAQNNDLDQKDSEILKPEATASIQENNANQDRNKIKFSTKNNTTGISEESKIDNDRPTTILIIKRTDKPHTIEVTTTISPETETEEITLEAETATTLHEHEESTTPLMKNENDESTDKDITDDAKINTQIEKGSTEDISSTDEGFSNKNVTSDNKDMQESEDDVNSISTTDAYENQTETIYILVKDNNATVATVIQNSSLPVSTEPSSTSTKNTTESVMQNLKLINDTIKKPLSEYHIQNQDVSNTKTNTSKPGSTWTLVPTIAPHSNVSIKQKISPQLQQFPEIIEPPSQIDLDPKPLQGFGLEESTSSLDADIYQFSQLCNELAFGFWKTVTNGVSTARSVFLSPFGATSLLAMVFLGARGATSGEMNEILKLDDMVTFNPHLIFKNVSESIKEDENSSGIAASAIVRQLFSDRSRGKLLHFYKERAKAFYDGFVEEVSFREIGDVIRRRTNLQVKKSTGGKITEFLRDSSILSRPPLAGISVNIFQTDCSQASTEGRNGELHFVVLPSIRQRRLVPVPAVVYRSNFLAGYEPSLDATAVSLGTKEKTVSTILVLPGQQGMTAPGDGLARLEKRLVESSFKKGAWSRLLRSLIPRPGLEVQIPRFAHRSVINATVALKKMGLHDLFDVDKADLRGLNGVPNELYLSDMLQINSFATCGEKVIGDTHHSEIYPASSARARKAKFLDLYESEDFIQRGPLMTEPLDYQRAFHDPLHDPTFLAVPLPLRPRQARLPETQTAETPRLKFDRPFLYFVRHNPTGLILHMGRFNPRLLP